MEPLELFYRFGAALVVGLLVGLQREYAFRRQVRNEDDELFAGARTFSLIALLGCAGAFIADEAGETMVVVAAILVLGGLLAVAHYVRSHEADTGLTTEVTALVTLLAGAICYWGRLELAAALGVATAVLLSLKVQTETLARALDREDVIATLKFAVITVIVLPVLPRQGYGPPPFDVLVPYNVWLMVVLISGISFLGYVLIKIVGTRRGVGLTGILGGMASSTAVTLSFAQRSRTAETLSRSFGLAIMLAWTLMFVRVLVEVGAIHAPLLGLIVVPITVAMIAGLAYCGYLYWGEALEAQDEEDEFKNPFELGPAITFGVLYAVILVGANAARSYFGDAGVYASSIVSGLVDVDAIALSMAQLAQQGEIAMPTAARAVVLAAASNTLLKGGIVIATGAAALRRVIVPGLVIVFGTALAMLFTI